MMSSGSRQANGAGRSGTGSASSSSASSPTRAARDNRPLLPRAQPALLLPPGPPPLHITIRFSTSLPDLELDIPSPQQTSVVALKHLIRGRLAADAEVRASSTDPSDADPAAQASRARLRFIHNGRILPDASVLSAVLKAPPPPPLSHQQPADPKGKFVAGAPRHQQQRVFINCSIGDELSDADLSAEARAASAPPPPPPPPPSSPGTGPGTSTSPSPSPSPSQPQPQSPPSSQRRPPTNPPLGFDRLLSAGLTPSEIATLRHHFRAIHTARFVPDAMPSDDALRAMEDAWLDSQSHAGGGSQPWSSDSYTGGGAEDEGGGAELAMEDAYGLSAVAGPLIRGMLVGFVFPLGVVVWLGKEERVWSRRMHLFVVFGVLLSLSVGIVRGLTGEG
ncbi:hypothetical protein VTK56DRAFT_9908 [Thermocarpiscus australiensis]